MRTRSAPRLVLAPAATRTGAAQHASSCLSLKVCTGTRDYESAKKVFGSKGKDPSKGHHTIKFMSTCSRTDFPLRTGAAHPVRAHLRLLLTSCRVRCLCGMADEPRQVLWHSNWFPFPLSCEKRHES